MTGFPWKSTRNLLASVGCGLVLLMAHEAHATPVSSVVLTWNAPTENIEDIEKYQVRWSLTADGSGGTLLDAGLALELQINDLPPQKVYFNVRAVDFLGQEGEWSANTTRSVKPAMPATMGGMTVQRVELVR